MKDLRHAGSICVLAALAIGVGGAEAAPIEGVVNLGYPAGSAGVSGDLVAFDVSERDHGGLDLNGDGDASDPVLFVHDAATGLTTNLRLAPFFGGFQVRDRLLGFGVFEQF